MLGKVHKVEIYIEVPREGPENLLYSMVRKAERKPPEMMEEKQELQYHGFEDPRSGPKCPMLVVSNKLPPRNQFVNLLRTVLVKKD